MMQASGLHYQRLGLIAMATEETPAATNAHHRHRHLDLATIAEVVVTVINTRTGGLIFPCAPAPTLYCLLGAGLMRSGN